MQNLYVLSDLAQEIIKLRAQAQDWVLVTHPQKEKIPSELFTALPSQNVAQEVAVISRFMLTLDCTKTVLTCRVRSRITNEIKTRDTSCKPESEI
jgi:hypothetical protein